MLWESINSYQEKDGFDLISWVILPDHMHLLVNPKKNNLSLLMRRIKLSFSTRYRRVCQIKSGRVWQYRFWDHIIRDQNDMNHHFDYIHYNPVKHGYVKSPFDWVYSSIHEYKEKGIYQDDWGVKNEIIFNGRFGE